MLAAIGCGFLLPSPPLLPPPQQVVTLTQTSLPSPPLSSYSSPPFYSHPFPPLSLASSLLDDFAEQQSVADAKLAAQVHQRLVSSSHLHTPHTLALSLSLLPSLPLVTFCSFTLLLPSCSIILVHLAFSFPSPCSLVLLPLSLSPFSLAHSCTHLIHESFNASSLIIWKSHLNALQSQRAAFKKAEEEREAKIAAEEARKVQLDKERAEKAERLLAERKAAAEAKAAQVAAVRSSIRGSAQAVPSDAVLATSGTGSGVGKEFVWQRERPGRSQGKHHSADSQCSRRAHRCPQSGGRGSPEALRLVEADYGKCRVAAHSRLSTPTLHALAF